MGLVVLGKDDAFLELIFKSRLDDPRQVQFLPHPEWHGHDEGSESCWSVGQVGFQQPFKFEQGLVVEAHVVEITGFQAGLSKTEIDSVFRETVVVFFSGKSLFLGRGNDLTVNQEGRGRVVIKSGDAKDFSHRFMKII